MWGSRGPLACCRVAAALGRARLWPQQRMESGSCCNIGNGAGVLIVLGPESIRWNRACARALVTLSSRPLFNHRFRLCRPLRIAPRQLQGHGAYGSGDHPAVIGLLSGPPRPSRRAGAW